jgi:cell division protein FtsI (penicillin-binding protein 3)
MIVVSPQTGDILAMVSRPAFDLNTKELITHKGKFPRGEVKEDGKVLTGDFNFACQTRYEPGSTFKVLAVTAAVDKGLMGIRSYVNCSPFSVGFGSKAINDRPFNYGSLPVWGVLKKSSNPGAARIAIVAKWQNYKEYLEKFGLNKPAGIDLPSGGACLLADGSNIVNYSRIAYGYSVAVSPLHMAMVYAAIANDGVRMKPRLIDKIFYADGAVYDECAPQEICRVMKSSTARDLRFALESVTERKGECGRGTATAAAIPGFRVGGKTGTAKKVKAGGGYAENLYTVSFAGVFPIDDPKLVVMTVIDEPHPTDCNPGGGTVAAPIFRAAAERFINVLNLAPSDPEAYEKYLATKQESANLKK